LRLKGIAVLINVDGIERKRAKWSAVGRLWYRLGELCSVLFASKVVADAEVIASYYKERFRTEALVIGYGAEPQPIAPGEVLNRYGLLAGQYILYVSRFEPENNALLTINGYKESGITLPLVMVGDAPYAEAYKQQLRAAAVGANVIFTGYQFGSAYRELRTNCRLYIQATEVGGTHPALVEAMAYGNVILANDCPEHREVLQDCGLYYDFNDQFDLAEKLRQLIHDLAMSTELSRRAATRARQHYSWERITDLYEEALLGFGSGRR
jgi:glycosyltransferase involved in cell wall biosynthesis